MNEKNVQIVKSPLRLMRQGSLKFLSNFETINLKKSSTTALCNLPQN